MGKKLGKQTGFRGNGGAPCFGMTVDSLYGFIHGMLSTRRSILERRSEGKDLFQGGYACQPWKVRLIGTPIVKRRQASACISKHPHAPSNPYPAIRPLRMLRCHALKSEPS